MNNDVISHRASLQSGVKRRPLSQNQLKNRWRGYSRNPSTQTISSQNKNLKLNRQQLRLQVTARM